MHFEVAPELLMSKWGQTNQHTHKHPKRLVERERLAARSLKTARARAHVHVVHVGHKIRVAPKTHTESQKKFESIRLTEVIVIPL